MSDIGRPTSPRGRRPVNWRVWLACGAIVPPRPVSPRSVTAHRHGTPIAAVVIALGVLAWMLPSIAGCVLR